MTSTNATAEERPTVEVRPARTTELTEIGRLTVEAYVVDEQIAADDGYATVLADTADRAANAELYVALVDGDIVGTVTFCPPGSTYREVSGDGQGEFRMLGVSAVARGRGVARALVDLCFERCRALGLDELVLCTMDGMVAARALYDSMGFVRDHDLDFMPQPGVQLIAYRAAV